MENVLAVAKAFNEMHTECYHKDMDQLRMHKLLYFAQKQSIKTTQKPLFSERFEGWRYGPVLKVVREEYKKDHPFEDVKDEISDGALKIVGYIFRKYKNLPSKEVSLLTHEEFSWQLSRDGLDTEDNGNEELLIDAIWLDVMMELTQELVDVRKGNVYGTYEDE